MLSALCKINYFSVAKQFDTYDFSTLYTSIPHPALKEALESLIQEAYRVRHSEYNNYCSGYKINGNAYWSNIPSTSSTKYNITDEMLIAYVEYLIDNIYVGIGNRVYRQCIGIPMGTDCAPLVANLFLFHYEYKNMRNLIKTNLLRAKNFCNTKGLWRLEGMQRVQTAKSNMLLNLNLRDVLLRDRGARTTTIPSVVLDV